MGREIRISGPGAKGTDEYPAVAWNSTGDEYLVVWADYRNYDTRNLDIYGRRVAG